MLDVAEDRSHLVSTSEAARHLGIAQSTLSRWVSGGHVRPTWRTPGGHMRWDLDDLDGQLEELEHGNAGPPFAPDLADAPRHPDEPS